jgi:hypothetical protein
MKAFLLIVMSVLLSLPSFVFAQSVGGGLGGDRPRYLMEEARPTLIANQQMTCSEVIQEVQRLGKVRINYQGFKVETFQVIYPTRSMNCNSPKDRKFIYAQTIDNNACPVGYSCQ